MKRRYKLTTAAKAHLVKNGEYAFRIGFEKTIDNVKYLHSQKKCPIITCTGTDILQIENEYGQSNLENLKSFVNKKINNSNIPSFFIFEDVTMTTLELQVTINIDTILNS